jgi:hypothetical protein
VVTDGIELPTEDARCRVTASLSPRSVLDVCREQLPAVEPQIRQSWQHCHAIEALYHPGRYVRIAYALLAEEAAPPERFWPKDCLCYFHWPVRRPMPRRGAVVHLNGCDVETYCFPDDRRLRRLRRFTRKRVIGRLWRSWVDGRDALAEADHGPVQRQLIRYVPEHKFVARLRARTLRERSSDAPHSSIALRICSPETCRALAWRHSAVAKLVRGTSKYLHVPDLVGVDAGGGLVAVEWVRGHGLLEKLRTGESTAVMRRMAEVLRSFHRVPSAGIRHLLPRDLCRRVDNAVSDLGVTCPELKPRLASLAAELRGRLKAVCDLEPVTLHNDLHWNQVRIHRNRYALLDLERMCTGDALVDVANFATQVRMLGFRPEYDVETVSATRWAAEFLTQWARVVGRPVAPDRFHLYAAISLLTLARSMMRHLRPGWRALAGRCVEQAEAELSSIDREVIGP